MEMKLDGNEYWVLENEADEGDNRLYNDKSEAITTIGELMEQDVAPEDITLMSVDIGSDELELRNVPWQEIAQGIVKS